MPTKLRTIDLFCGCGGMTQGLDSAGLDIIAGIDVWNKAIDSYSANHTHLSICEDLTNYPPETFKKNNKIKGKIDVIVGGPPCFLSNTKVVPWARRSVPLLARTETSWSS